MIGVTALDKTFVVGGRSVRTLCAIDFTLAPGEFLAVIGASGSGKTTLIRTIAGLERPDGGRITLRDSVVFDAETGIDVSPQDRRLGMVFQSYAIWPHLTVLENVMLPLLKGRRKTSRSQARAAAMEALDMVGVGNFAERPAPLLSGGQQQRVALARALAVSPDVLLMDEPLSNLDAQLREDVRRELKSLTKRLGATVLYVTHDIAEAMSLGDRILVLDRGNISQIGMPTDVYARPMNSKLAEFLGRINLIDGRACDHGLIETPLGMLKSKHSLPVNRPVTVGIRPEGIKLHREGLKGDGDYGVLKMTVVDREYLGAYALIELRCRDQRLVAEWRGSRLPGVGETVIAELSTDLLVFGRDADSALLPTQ